MGIGPLDEESQGFQEVIIRVDEALIVQPDTNR